MKEFTRDIIRQHYSKEQDHGIDLLKQFQYLIYGLDSEENDMYMIAKIIKEEEVRERLFQYFANATLVFPDFERKEYLDIMAIVYYLRSQKKMGWADIRKALNIDKEDERFSTTNMSKEYTRIDEGINEYIRKGLELLNKEKSLESFLKEITA